MDYSALSEAQQQYYSSQQQQQQQPQQDPQYHHQQAAYTQSYDAYYAAYHHQNQNHDASQYHQQQYSAAVYPHQYYYSAQDSSSSSSYYQPAPAQPETAGVGPSNPSQIHGHVYSAGPAQPETVAVAALSQLSQLADTMDRAAAMAGRHWQGKGGPPPPGPHHPGSRGRGRSSNRGGGRRGGVSFRDGGGGRGNFNHQPPRQDGGEPSAFRGRGRGRGRGLMGRSRGRKSYQSAPATAGEQSLAPESAQQAPTRAPPAQRRPILPVAWCDICRVDCNSVEILEQHKSGKRHKKTVQRVEEIQKQQKLFDELQAKDMPEMAPQSTEANLTVQTKEVYKASSVVGITPNAAGLSAQVGDATKVPIKQEIEPSAVFSAVQVDGANRAIGASGNEQCAELTLKQDLEFEAQKGHTAEGQPKVAKEEMTTEASPSYAPVTEGSVTEGQRGHPKFGVYDRFDRRRGGLKRQMTRFGRGGKRLKTFESARGRVPERPKDQPRVCTLCNIMCDTLAVFECHLSGKKHMSKLRRFQGQGSVYGPIRVYIPPNQPSTYPTKGQDPLFYGLKCHETLQLEASGDLNGLQVENYGVQQHGDQSERTRGAEIGGPDSQAMEILDYPEGEVVAEKEDKEGLTMDYTVTQNIIAFDCEVEDPSLAPIALASDSNSVAVDLFTTGEYVIPLPEFGDHLGDDVRLPGLGAEVEDLGPNTEELANKAEMSSK